MLEDPGTISAALELLLVSRNLERVADLATNIGEDAVYLAEGKTIKHHLEDGGIGQPAAGPGPTVAGAEG
jgi:phosphate transport system protein